jgi:hypothetical protein
MAQTEIVPQKHLYMHENDIELRILGILSVPPAVESPPQRRY